MKLLTNMRQLAQRMFAGRWQQLLRQHAGYLSTEGWYHWQTDAHAGWLPRHTNLATPRIVVLSRQLYREFSKDYPVNSKADLTAVLANEFIGKQVFHLSVALPEQGFRVTSYEVLPAALAQLQRYCLLLPESWLIQQAASQDQLVQITQSWGRYFVFRHGNRAGSQLTSALCADAESVLHVQGLPEDLPIRLCTEAESRALLWHSLSQQFSVQLWHFGCAGQGQKKVLPWRWLATSAATVLIAYFAAAALFIDYQQRQTEAEVAAMGPEVQQLLDQQNEAETLKSQLTELSAQLNTVQPIFPLWQIVEQLLSQHIQVRSLQVNMRKVEISGLAERATDVLQMLKNTPGVTQVEFSAPTRRDQGLDLFSISLQLQGLTTAPVKAEVPHEQ